MTDTERAELAGLPERDKAIRHLCEAITFLTYSERPDANAMTRLKIVRDYIRWADRQVENLQRAAGIRETEETA